ncbi:MAG TPA: DeoR family transcriptional regulator [Candidatus Paceibacterota bacterium]
MILPDTLRDKSREIAYALIRVSYYIKRSDLKARLENHAFSLLEITAQAVLDKDDKQTILKTVKHISVLDTLIRIGHSIYEIEPVNATILVRELDLFNSAIRQFGNLDESLPDLDSMFSKVSLPVRFDKQSIDSDGIEEKESRTDQEYKQESDDIQSVMRQSAIISLAKFGKEGVCRMKDLIAAFPDVSERTLRYDLKKLCDQGALERVGISGPGSYYRLLNIDERNTQK